AVQPVQVSTVAWIGGRTDSLAAVWVALFAWSLIRGVKSEGKARALLLGLSTFAYLCALLTKEQTVVLLPLVPLAFACFASKESASSKSLPWLATLPFLLVMTLFFTFWKLIGPKLPPMAYHDLGYQASLFGRSVTYYTLLLLTPVPRF